MSISFVRTFASSFEKSTKIYPRTHILHLCHNNKIWITLACNATFLFFFHTVSSFIVFKFWEFRFRLNTYISKKLTCTEGQDIDYIQALKHTEIKDCFDWISRIKKWNKYKYTEKKPILLAKAVAPWEYELKIFLHDQLLKFED